MSKQTDNPGSDSRVSDVYRSIADERAPEHLNESVMRMAAKGSRTPYARARAWLRPAAWAATIGLSLAIVLELTRLPQESLHYDDVPADAASSEPYQPDSAQPAEASAVTESSDMTPDKAPLGEKWRARELPAKAVPAPAMLDQEISADAAEDAPQSKIEARSDARRMLPMRAEQQSFAPQFLCPADARDSADRWYDCIESLRDTVPESRIATELEHLVAKYPDFVLPEDK